MPLPLMVAPSPPEDGVPKNWATCYYLDAKCPPPGATKEFNAMKLNGSCGNADWLVDFQLKILRAMLAVGATMFLPSQATAAGPRYRLERIYSAVNPNDASHATDINDSGYVLVNGYQQRYSPYWYSFIWKDGQTIESVGEYGLAINNKHQVSGYNGTASSSSGYFWNGAQFIRLSEIPGGQYWNRPHALNDAGDVYGYSLADYGSPGGWQRAVGWMASGQVFELGIDSTGFVGTLAMAASNAGHVVGYNEDRFANKYQAWMWQAGVVEILATMPNAVQPRSWAYGVNDAGQIVGSYFDLQEGITVGGASLWENGTLRILPPPPGLEFGQGRDINERGFVVGFAGSKAALWNPAGRGFALQELVEDLHGWTLDIALAINNRNEIVGTAHDPQGVQRGFLLTPIVPEPSNGLLILVVSVILGPCWRHRVR